MKSTSRINANDATRLLNRMVETSQLDSIELYPYGIRLRFQGHGNFLVFETNQKVTVFSDDGDEARFSHVAKLLCDALGRIVTSVSVEDGPRITLCLGGNIEIVTEPEDELDDVIWDFSLVENCDEKKKQILVCQTLHEGLYYLPGAGN